VPQDAAGFCFVVLHEAAGCLVAQVVEDFLVSRGAVGILLSSQQAADCLSPGGVEQAEIKIKVNNVRVKIVLADISHLHG